MRVNNNTNQDLRVACRDDGASGVRFSAAAAGGLAQQPRAGGRSGRPAVRDVSGQAAVSPGDWVDIELGDVSAGGTRPGGAARQGRGTEGNPPIQISYRRDGSVTITIGDATDTPPVARRAMDRTHTAVTIPEELTIAGHLGTLIPEELDVDTHRALEDHLGGVAARLDQKGETLESIKAVCAKARRRDVLAALFSGAANSVPYAIAGLTTDFTPQFFASAEKLRNPVGQAVAISAQAAAVGHTVDTMACHAFTNRLVPPARERYWLAAKEDDLVEPAAKAQKAMEPSLLRQVRDLFLVYQVGLGRNAIVQPILAAVEAAASPAAAATADSVLTNTLGIAAGSVRDIIRHGIETSAGRYGALWLFGRKDWEKVYDAVKMSPPSEPAINVARNLALLPGDAVFGLWDNLRNLVSPAPLAQGVVLTGGLAAASATRAAVRGAAQGAGMSRLAGEHLGRLAEYPIKGVVYGAWSAVAPLATAATDKLGEMWKQKTGLAPQAPPATPDAGAPGPSAAPEAPNAAVPEDPAPLEAAVMQRNKPAPRTNTSV